LENRTQRVVINGYKSDVKFILAGVPQGSVLGPLLFIVYINDIVDGINSNIRLFADDTSIYVIVDDPATAAYDINNDLDKISTWANKWQVKFNPEKTVTILFSRKHSPSPKLPLYMDDVRIKEVTNHKHLGITFQSDCLWDKHIDDIVNKVSPMINCLRSFKYRLSRKTLNTMYKSFILPVFDYSCHIWDNCTKEQATMLEKLNLDALRTICGAVRGTSHTIIYNETDHKPLVQRRHAFKLTTYYKMVNHISPNYLCDLVPPPVSENSNYELRNRAKLQNINCRTVSYAKSFLPDTTKIWNSLSDSCTTANTLGEFKSIIKKESQKEIYFDLNLGTRNCQIIHTRLRLGCSDLNADKFNRFLTTIPSCSCGHYFEDALHYFLTCSEYTEIRSEMYFYSKGFDLKSILYGCSGVSASVNREILQSVHSFISRSRRFSKLN